MRSRWAVGGRGHSTQLHRVFGSSLHVTETPTPARRGRWTVPILAAAGVVAVVAIGAVLVRNRDHSAPVGEALPSASPGVVTASYVEIHWRLAAVTDRQGTTATPGSAWLELATDG